MFNISFVILQGVQLLRLTVLCIRLFFNKFVDIIITRKMTRDKRVRFQPPAANIADKFRPLNINIKGEKEVITIIMKPVWLHILGHFF
jgi:hypothetical protein